MKQALAGAALAALTLFAARAPAAEPPLLRVIVIETGDPKAYRHELENVLRLERTVVPEATARVWQARFAGAEVGTLVVTAELPSLAALAKLDELERTNAEFAASLKRIRLLRHIVSDSLYEEILP